VPRALTSTRGTVAGSEEADEVGTGISRQHPRSPPPGRAQL